MRHFSTLLNGPGKALREVLAIAGAISPPMAGPGVDHGQRHGVRTVKISHKVVLLSWIRIQYVCIIIARPTGVEATHTPSFIALALLIASTVKATTIRFKQRPDARILHMLLVHIRILPALFLALVPNSVCPASGACSSPAGRSSRAANGLLP